MLHSISALFGDDAGRAEENKSALMRMYQETDEILARSFLVDVTKELSKSAEQPSACFHVFVPAVLRTGLSLAEIQHGWIRPLVTSQCGDPSRVDTSQRCRVHPRNRTLAPVCPTGLQDDNRSPCFPSHQLGSNAGPLVPAMDTPEPPGSSPNSDGGRIFRLNRHFFSSFPARSAGYTCAPSPATQRNPPSGLEKVTPRRARS